MAHFTTGGKRYREGTDFPSFGGVDLDVPVTGTTTYQQEAPPTLPDGAGPPRSFLFWDTGRRLTGKRRVRWTFNHAAEWTSWNAAAWYGTPSPDGPGSPVVTVDAFWVGTGTMDPTPIDGPGSTFVNGPSGELAWPWNGNDHQVRTEWGPATIRALGHLQRTPSDPVLDFSSLSRLTFGGDGSGTFEENDDGITSGGGIPGIESTTAQQLGFAQGEGGLLLAGYVRPVVSVGLSPFLEQLLEMIESSVIDLPDRGDPGPDDIIRLKLIAESLDLVRGERPTDADAFEGLVSAGKKMSPAQLKRTIAGTRATLRRGEAALKSLEALAAKAPKPR